MTKTNDETWPDLPLDHWRDTCDTLHLLTQIAGKIRLNLTPAEPQWGHASLFLNQHGITTGPIPYNGRLLKIEFDLISHQIIFSSDTGQEYYLPLTSMTISEYYKQFIVALSLMNVSVKINPKPQEINKPIFFYDDRAHFIYDPVWANRFWTILRQVYIVLNKYRAPYLGKTTPVNFWWGTFDLSVSRFSGLPADSPPNAGLIIRQAMNAELIETGFWPGDDRFREPAFYSFTYPQPEKIMLAQILPKEASWSDNLREFILPYQAVRQAEDPEKMILDFCQSTFCSGAKAAGWNLKNLIKNEQECS